MILKMVVFGLNVSALSYWTYMFLQCFVLVMAVFLSGGGFCYNNMFQWRFPFMNVCCNGEMEDGGC